MIDLELLPDSFRNYRQPLLAVYDIETLQTSIETDDMNSLVYEALQIPCSIGFDSNIPGVDSKFIVRASSDPEDGYRMVKEFMDHLRFAQDEFIKNLPDEVQTAQEKLSAMLKQRFSKSKAKLQSYDLLLKKISQFNVFGYNSSRFDIPGLYNS